jgi:hypothetical protein
VQEIVDNFKPTTKREYVAFMIANAFNDLGQIKLYINCCKKYPLALVFRAFSEAKTFPKEKIKKSRAAIFFYLIKTYARQRNQNFGY